jgi:hypothetical protein
MIFEGGIPCRPRNYLDKSSIAMIEEDLGHVVASEAAKRLVLSLTG